MPAPKWTPATIHEICEYFNKLADETICGDGSKSDVQLQLLSNVFWRYNYFPVQRKGKGWHAA